MTVTLHTPTLGIIVIIFLLGCYIAVITNARDLFEKIGYTFLFGFGILGVFIGGVLPFLV
jgi:hypothetical protein